MTQRFILTLMIILCGATFSLKAFSHNIEGIIRSSGSKINYRVVIKEKGGAKDHILCPGKIADQINTYQRMHAKITVSEAKMCLQPSSFSLIKTAGGTDPIIGTLIKEGDFFAISHNNIKFILENIPRRMKSFENKQIVLELAKSLSKQNQGNLYNVLFFAPAP